MTFDGLEIDMLAVGNADCILVTRWVGEEREYVLIDGGNVGSFGALKEFLVKRGISHLHHVVNTHPHDDHAGGLVPLLKDRTIGIGSLWMHLPWKHLDYQAMVESFGVAKAQLGYGGLMESVDRSVDIAKLCDGRRLTISEPFHGSSIGPLSVCGPTKQYYEELLHEFMDVEKIRTWQANRQIQDRSESLLEMASQGEEALEANPQTQPENNSCVILRAAHGDSRFLFTGDAGAQALLGATQNPPDNLQGLYWMQIPHHGSRHNISPVLIDHFKPKYAFVSAKPDDAKHPRRSVVNRFKQVGTKVYSTHYPYESPLHIAAGSFPPREGTIPATPLYEKKQ